MSIELIVGLGNPGSRYQGTRHNLGFRVVDELARRHDGDPWARARHAELTSVRFGPRLLLAKPMTFMNRSGVAVEWLLGHLDVEPEQILVVVDDVDLGLGSLRLRPAGGPGTHNGMRDLCRRIGTGFPRLRLGVRGGEAPGDLADYVLSPFAPAEEARAELLVRRGANAAEAAIRDGVQRAMSEFNRVELERELDGISP
jgi:PTH1 family peptidyl-tRNA hydrolase